MMPWRALVLSLAFVHALVPTEITPQPRSEARDRPLRVMTYNIKHGQSNAKCTQPPAITGQPPSPDCNLNLDGTIAVLRARAPDIVALQEVDRFWARSAYADQPALIAPGLKMPHHCFAPNLDHPADNHSNRPHQYGTAIFSRFPITTCTNTLLTTFPEWEQRGILGAVVDAGGVTTRVYSTHLQASRNVGGRSESGAPQRILQVQGIMKLLSEVTDPIVLMGDFNAGETSAEMAPLRSRLYDVWSTPVGASKGYTSPARLEGDPTSHIDYIFVSKNVRISSVSVPIDATTRLASDHYPVVASLTLPRSATGR